MKTIRVTTEELRIVDWHQQIKRLGKEWPVRVGKRPMEVAAAANLVKQTNTPFGVCFFLEKCRSRGIVFLRFLAKQAL